MAGADALARGRSAFDRGLWRAAHADLSAADRVRPLAAEDLQRLATATYLIGHAVESEEIWARAHVRWLDAAAVDRAVRCAFWLTYSLLNRGQMGPASGWIARCHRLLADRPADCVEQGYLLLPLGLQTVDAGDAAGAHATFDQMVKLGERFGDPDLVAMGPLGLGTALLRLGETGAGMATFDQAMVSISIAEVSPIAVGVVYCGVIEECHAAFDLRRAQEWTAALGRWCDAQPELVPGGRRSRPLAAARPGAAAPAAGRRRRGGGRDPHPSGAGRPTHGPPGAAGRVRGDPPGGRRDRAGPGGGRRAGRRRLAGADDRPGQGDTGTGSRS